MERNLTHGPWRVENDCAWTGVHTENGDAIACLCMDTWEGVATQEDANLIAAAPDMYEALRWQCGRCELGSEGECYICPIGQAIRKANGE